MPEPITEDKPFANVAEPWALYDTVIICNTMYGKEATINGWFTSWNAFAQQEKHTFFKSRTSGNSHLAYCNMDSADNVDFVFKAISFGVRFFGPSGPDSYFENNMHLHLQEIMSAFWLFDMPRHCGIDLKVQQDTIIEDTCMAAPPGYGPRGGGNAHPIPHLFTSDPPDPPLQAAWKVTTGTQGEPVIDCRFPLPNMVSIPRNTPIEANLFVGAYARYILGNIYGPGVTGIYGGGIGADPTLDQWTNFPCRYGIQVSLFGMREVQQRGQYHAS